MLWLFFLLLAGPADTVPFADGSLALRAGAIFPAGSLARHYDPAASFGASLSMAYWKDVRTRLDANYAHLKGDVELNVLRGAAGFDWHPAPLPLELGISLALFYVRDDPDSIPRQIDGAESEFGLTGRLAIPLWRRNPWALRLETEGEFAFTRPHGSAFVQTGLSLSRRIW